MISIFSPTNCTTEELEEVIDLLPDDSFRDCVVSIWVDEDGRYNIVSNVSESEAISLLASALVEMAEQGGGTAH